MNHSGVRAYRRRLAAFLLLPGLSACAILPGAGMPFPDEVPADADESAPAGEIEEVRAVPDPAATVPVDRDRATALPTPTPTPPAPLPEGGAQQAALPPLAPLVITQVDEVPPAPVLDSEVLSLLLADPVPVVDLLRLLLRDTEISLVPEPDLDETFAGELKEVSLRRALALVLEPLGLGYRLERQALFVFRRPPQTRVFEINAVATRRVATRRVSSGAAGAGSELVSTDDRDRLAEIERAVESQLSDAGRAHLDRGAGLLRVTDTPARLDSVARYLDRVEERAGRQIRIDALVVEVTFFDDATRGIDWARLVPGDRPVLRASAEVDRFLQALDGEGTLTLVSRPFAVTLNNQPVQVRVGGDGPGDGVTLAMTPQVGLDGVVTLSVTPRVTTRGRPGVGFRTVRETDTLFRLQDGETAVLGGWFRRLDAPADQIDASVALEGPVADGTALGADPDPVASDLVILLTPTVLGI